MTDSAVFVSITSLAGGLALFIFGMQVMTEGLRLALGVRLQRLLGKTTRKRLGGFSLGIALGVTIHSSAATVMLVGFVNAGLLTLGQSVAPILGANVGTTISMQVISLRVGDYAYLAIVSGLIISLVLRSSGSGNFGRALLGFGLLFMGMNIMSAAIRPHRETLALFLSAVDGDGFTGLLLGIAISAGLTALWQSSGATIAILFAMIDGGVVTSFQQIVPIVLGAHLGTCATGLLGSIGAGVEARRCAMTHLYFNCFNVALAVIAMPLFRFAVSLTSRDLVRLTANLHTAVMLTAALILLPFTGGIARAVRFSVARKEPAAESSHLDYGLTEYPERGIVAVIRELRRVVGICSRNLYLAAQVALRKYDRVTIAEIRQNEQAIDGVKRAMTEYIAAMTRKYLSRRQIVMYQHLNRGMADIERIGDHIEQSCEISLRRPAATLDKESAAAVFFLFVESRRMLRLLMASFDQAPGNFQVSADKVLKARERYIRRSMAAEEVFMKKNETHEIDAAAAFRFREYIAVMDRMNRHIENIALAQQHQDFRIKPAKLDKPSRRKREP